jgi:hypothetical protein
VPERAGAFIYSLLCFYGGVIAVDSAILRLVVLVLLMGLPLSKANPIKVVTGLVRMNERAKVGADDRPRNGSNEQGKR